MCRVITNKCQTLPGSAAQKWLLAMLGNLILGDVARSHMGKFGGYCPLKTFLEKKESIFPERCKKKNEEQNICQKDHFVHGVG